MPSSGSSQRSGDAPGGRRRRRRTWVPLGDSATSRRAEPGRGTSPEPGPTAPHPDPSGPPGEHPTQAWPPVGWSGSPAAARTEAWPRTAETPGPPPAETPGPPPAETPGPPSDQAPEPAADGLRQPSRGRPHPSKLTVTRVAAWRSRQITEQGIRAFRRAATADGADKSGLTAMTYATMTTYAADAALAVALANTLFFSAATAESKAKVALYLLITVAPFGLIAPVIGPALDRLQRGRRVALAASFAGRLLLAIVLARYFDTWALYPAALGMLVLSKAYAVLRSAVTPRVLPRGITLVKTNSRLTTFGLAAGAVGGAVAAGCAKVFGSPGALVFTAVVCLAGAWLCLTIPSWVEVTEGEVPASLSAAPGRGRRQPMGAGVVTSLWGNGTIRVLTGFLTLFVAFVVKAQTEHAAFVQLALLGLIGAAAGVGSFLGNSLGARQDMGRPDQVILGSLAACLTVTVLTAVLQGIVMAALVALVGATASSLAKVSLDAVIQRDMPEVSRASAFGRSETILQLAWVFGGALGVLLPPEYWLGFTVVAVLLGLGTVQTVLARRGSSLVPGFGGGRPRRPGVSPADR